MATKGEINSGWFWPSRKRKWKDPGQGRYRNRREPARRESFGLPRANGCRPAVAADRRQRPAKLQYALRQRIVGDCRLTPNRVNQFRLAHYMALPLDKVRQHFECFGLKGDLLTAVLQKSAVQVKHEIAEAVLAAPLRRTRLGWVLHVCLRFNSLSFGHRSRPCRNHGSKPWALGGFLIV